MDRVHGPGPWGGPWWSMDKVHGVVHGPRSMFCIRPINGYDKCINGYLEKIFTAKAYRGKIKLLLLCPLYQWPVELTRQNDGEGRLPRDLFFLHSIPWLFRQAQRNLHSDNLNVLE